MSLRLVEIPRVEQIAPNDFSREYLAPRRPVIIRRLSHAWPAYRKWTFEYFKKLAGDQVVPLYDSSKADASKKVNEPAATMKFGDYLDLIQREPTELRMFTFNVAQRLPDVRSDYSNPPYLRHFIDQYPMLFFGGAGARVFMHFDIDLPHIFHTQFLGKKRVLLVSPDQTPRMYKLPLSWHAIEDIDWRNPDFRQFPALRGVTAQTGVLEHGDTLFMPSGWWHFNEYLEGGFAISLRAIVSPAQSVHAFWNLTVVRTVDNLLRKHVGPRWFDYKERSAIERSNQYARDHDSTPDSTATSRV